MIYLVIFGIFTIGLPLIVVGFRRNFRSLILSYVIPVSIVAVWNRVVCAQGSSEACTWGYWKYFLALFIACLVYLFLSFSQAAYQKLQRRRGRNANT